MSYVATSPADYNGKAVGSGQCVAYVQVVSGAPLTKKWKQGVLVKGTASIPPGTAIACFDANGTYGNHTDGTSHAAIYMAQDANGLQVWDQWLGQPVHQRTLHFDDARKPVNNGNKFHVIE